MISFVCFKWKSDGYRSTFTGQHVNALRDMVAKHYQKPHRFICITDDAEGIAGGIEIVPIWDDCADIPNPSFTGGPSCYRRLKVFSKEFGQIAGERFVCMDLDVIITSDLSPLVDRDENFVAWKDPGRKWPYNGSMFMLRAGSRAKVWDDFDPEKSPALAKAAGCRGSDQGWISYILGPDEATWSTEDGIYSWSMELRNGRTDLPANSKVIVFHGAVDPWHADAQRIKWVREHYKMAKQPKQSKPGKDFTSLIGKHKGKTICVMGGSASLADHLSGLKADVWISANEHGAKLRKVDYVVSMDEEHSIDRENMRGRTRKHTQAPIIGPFSHNDYIMTDWPGAPRRLLSGVVAMWVAHAMGAKEIILAGMDAYAGDQNSMNRYREMAKHIPGLITVRGEGCLTVIFPPNGTLEERMTVDPVLARLSGSNSDLITAIAKKPTSYNGRSLAKGESVVGTRFELRRLLKHGVLVEVASGVNP